MEGAAVVGGSGLPVFLVSGALLVYSQLSVSVASVVLAGVFGGGDGGVEHAVHPEAGDAGHLAVAFVEQMLGGGDVRCERDEQEMLLDKVTPQSGLLPELVGGHRGSAFPQRLPRVGEAAGLAVQPDQA
jgi:hypothetical protein